jgi:ribosome maturation factor RimP
MIDCNKILAIAEQEMEGTDLFTVSCKCSPMNEVELLIDSDSAVSIEQCINLTRKIEEEFDRDVEDFSLTVTSAGIGEPLKLLRQYQKIVGSTVEVLLKDGIKILATLDSASEEGIVVSYDEKVAVEGKKRKELQHTVRTYRYEQIKAAKEYLDYK